MGYIHIQKVLVMLYVINKEGLICFRRMVHRLLPCMIIMLWMLESQITLLFLGIRNQLFRLENLRGFHHTVVNNIKGSSTISKYSKDFSLPSINVSFTSELLQHLLCHDHFLRSLWYKKYKVLLLWLYLVPWKPEQHSQHHIETVLMLFLP